jgi:thioesterase domain-containing protein
VATDLSRHVGADQPFYGVQPVGLDGETPPLTDLVAMARRYVEEIRAVAPHGPYYLGGYCMGGVIALEMARRLEAAGERVALLCAIDSDIEKHVHALSAPLLGRRALRAALDARARAQDIGASPGDLGRPLRLLGERLRVLAGGFGGALVGDDDLREAALAMPGMEDWPEDYRRMVPFNLRAALGYRAAPWSGRVLLVRRDAPLLPAGLEDPSWGWRLVARGGVEIRRVEGAHDEIMNEPHVRRVAAILRAGIDEARARWAAEQGPTGASPRAAP